MTTPTIEEMVETYWTAWNKSGDPGPVIRDDDVFVNIRAGLLAVIDKHFGTLLLKACGQAMACADPASYQGEKTDAQLLAATEAELATAKEIVASILAQLKGQSK